MLVSAVITTHKREPEIVERALKSILNQTYKNIEIFVVDDSPADYEQRDAVASMVRGYETNGVTYIPHESCKGACAARNTGLAAAKGEFIGFLDDDDEWLPEKIEEQLKGFISDEIALVYCSNKTIYDDSGKESTNTIPHITGRAYEKLMIEGNFIGSTSFPLIRTQMLRGIDGFDVEMQSSQDYDVWLRLAQKYEINFVDFPLVAYHFHSGEQITSNPIKKVYGLSRIISKNREFLNINAAAKWRLSMLLVEWYAKAGMSGKAFCTWLRNIFKAPFRIKSNLKYLHSICYYAFHKR